MIYNYYIYNYIHIYIIISICYNTPKSAISDL